MKRLFLLAFCFAALCSSGQKPNALSISSPNGKINIKVEVGKQLKWSVTHQGQPVITPSVVSMTLTTGEVLGVNLQIKSKKVDVLNETFVNTLYKKKNVINNCAQLTLNFSGNYGIVFRAYDDGVAYRFFTARPGELTIQSEQVQYSFDKDYSAFIPHTSDLRNGDRYACSFEEFYTKEPLSKLNKDTLAYLPLLVQLDQHKSALLIEADVQDYPLSFIKALDGGVHAAFAPYPLEEALPNPKSINYLPTKRADYIAKVNGRRNFPWRAIVISENDKELLNNDMVQKLSEPSKIADPSWIKPGKVAWDWWNDWNISHVDFRAGINTPTYKYYIDFAAANHVEYVVLDEGWSDDWDLNKLSPAINLQELLQYASQKNVGLILWTTWYALTRDVEALCAKYSSMGVKGFKVDFLDRNDQKTVASCYEIAAVAAKHHLMLDFHGMFPPQGLQRTWPNVVNFEGVRGMEYMKWNADERVPQHETSLPFIRMVAGPMDYTPWAMRNMTKGNSRSNPSMPMSTGTRVHQMAMYVLFEAPLEMLADNPTAYMKEQECTDMITSLPTVFDETVALDGQVGAFAALARRKGTAWYVAGITNWDARDIEVDLSFLGDGNFKAELFRDGINADRDATDYKKELRSVNAAQQLSIHLAPGGGFLMRITKE